MSQITIEVRNLEDVKRAFKTAPERTRVEMTKALKLSAYLTQRVEKEEAPIDRGYLRGSIDVRYLNNAVVIWPRANYAINVHEGTGLYGPNHQRIYPKKGKVLAWKSGGKMHFARSTAGQRPNRFADRTVDRVRGEVNDYFSTAIDNVIRGK